MPFVASVACRVRPGGSRSFVERVRVRERGATDQAGANPSYSPDVRLLILITLFGAVLSGTAAAGSGGRVPNWSLQLRVSRWVAPSSFAARVTGQTAGLKVRRGLRVTLVLDRRTRCVARLDGGAATTVRCATVRPTLARRGALLVDAGGQFETGHLGAIGFRARTVTLLL